MVAIGGNCQGDKEERLDLGKESGARENGIGDLEQRASMVGRPVAFYLDQQASTLLVK
jgi:hypothetical protein